jgi:hypothetical protein
MQTGSSETLFGWKSGKPIYIPVWDRNGGSVTMDFGHFYTLCQKGEGKAMDDYC